MLPKLLTSIFGSRNDRLLKQYRRVVGQINALEPAFETLDDADLAKVVTLGGYAMPKAEILAQIWIHHAIAHAYEGSARWPLL